MGKPLNGITIVGGGTAGWLTAALLQAFGRKAQNGQKPLEITLIESPNIPTVGVGEATTPAIVRTLQNAGISEKDFFKRCNASFKLAVSFDGWNVDKKGKPISYLNPFTNAPSLHGIDLAYYFNRFGSDARDFASSYLPTGDIIKAHKGPRATGAKEYDQSMGFAYHLDAGKFAELLTEHCTGLGVRHVRENVLDIELAEDGSVAALQLEESGRHPVELVIDCTGFRGMIINKALEEPFISYSNFLANDRAMALQVPHPDQTKIEPVTRSVALGAGWSWRVPLYNRIGTGYVFSSAHRTDEEARDEFLHSLRSTYGTIPEDAEPRVIPMRVGRNRNAWVKNCVAIGLSGGFIEPLESTAIYMIDMSVRWLLNYFPDSDFADPPRDRFNRIIDSLYNEVRDFICLHYKLGNRTDSQYWIDARTELDVPNSLAENLELWRYNLPQVYDLPTTFLFAHPTYIAVLMGKRVYETDYAKSKIGSYLSLDAKAWKTAQASLKKRNRESLRRAADHHTLLRELRGEMESAPLFVGASGPVFQPASPTVSMPGFAPPKISIRAAAPTVDPVEKESASLL